MIAYNRPLGHAVDNSLRRTDQLMACLIVFFYLICCGPLGFCIVWCTMWLVCVKYDGGGTVSKKIKIFKSWEYDNNVVELGDATSFSSSSL